MKRARARLDADWPSVNLQKNWEALFSFHGAAMVEAVLQAAFDSNCPDTGPWVSFKASSKENAGVDPLTLTVLFEVLGPIDEEPPHFDFNFNECLDFDLDGFKADDGSCDLSPADYAYLVRLRDALDACVSRVDALIASARLLSEAEAAAREAEFEASSREYLEKINARTDRP